MSIKYSVVIPVKDEEENLQPLFSELHQVMEEMGAPWEVIFVDDGSTDNSYPLLLTLSQRDAHITLLSFDRNYGQSSAFAAGFAHAQGEFVITLDADLQNNPSDIPKLLKETPKADLVCGWRIDRKDPWQKRGISKISNRIRGSLLQDHMHDTGCSLKIFRRSALDKIKLYDGMHRFFPALFILEGFTVTEVPVSHRPRIKGRTKYHFFNRSLKPILDLLALVWMRKRQLHYQIKGR